MTDRVPQKDLTRRHTSRLDARSNAQEVEQSKETPTIADPSTKYAKRARHKAKPDKYEYKGEAQAKKNLRNHKRKRTRSGSVGKEDFHADNIDAERVTLKPGGEQFVFSRSKMSVPLAGHDLPDLTFTKMDFLSRPRSSAQRGPTKVLAKQDRKDDATKKDRKSHIQSDTDVQALQTKRMSAKADACSTELSGPNHRGDSVQIPRSSDGINGTPRRRSDHSSWVRSKADPRLEEYRPASKSTNSCTPVSWSTSPQTRHTTQVASVSQQAVNSTSSREQVESKKAISHVGTQALPARSSPSDDMCDDLTQRLLQRPMWSDIISPHQDSSRKYQSLEDLKSISDAMSRRRSLDDPCPKRSNPLHNRSHIGLRGPTEPNGAHRPPPLYTDDIIRQQQYQGYHPSHALRDQLTQGIHEPTYYDSELALPDQYAPHRLNGVSYMIDSDITERLQSPVLSRRSHQQQNLALQQLYSSPQWVQATEFIYERDRPDDATYLQLSDQQQLDEFDLELLKKAKMDKLQRGSLPVANLRHPNQENNTWLRSHVRNVDQAHGITTPPLSFATNSLIEHSLSRTGMQNEEQATEQTLVVERPSLQYRNSQSLFNPFRNSRTLF